MRKLQPCGTYAAYKRHLNKGEMPCEPCRSANRDRVAMAPSGNSTAREVTRLEVAMAERPPVIRWRFDPVRRVQIAWYVDDPYMDHPNGVRTDVS